MRLLDSKLIGSSYVTKDDIDQFGSTEERLHDLSSDGWLGQEWLAKSVDHPSYKGIE